MIEGNYQVGEMAPIIFDRDSLRYLAAYRSKGEMPELEMPREEEAVVVRPRRVCIIELIDPPTVVQPMRYYYGEGIKEGEVEGVDYIKTYYKVDLSLCAGCEVMWNMLSHKMGEKTDFEQYKFHNPFIFTDPSVLEWWDVMDDKEFYNFENPRPDDHLLYNLGGVGGAEILEFGSDGGGDWIKWKAYTEYGYKYPWLTESTRTGYGVIEIMPYVGRRRLDKVEPGNQTGKVIDTLLCFDKARITVDCCQKHSDLREVEMWWESQEGLTCAGQEFIFVGGTKMCRVPKLMGLYYLYRVSWFGNSAINVLPTIFGGCPPFEWTLNGVGDLILPTQRGWPDTNVMAWYQAPTDSSIYYQCKPVKIGVKDRCGTSYEVEANCCKVDGAPPMHITYASLIMGKDEEQTLSAWSGCPPFDWDVAGGGSIISKSDDGSSIIYKAPSDNPDCTYNPTTITVRDCCGQSAQIQVYISTWTGTHIAMGIVEWKGCGACYAIGTWPYQHCVVRGDWRKRRWDCMGILINECWSNPDCAILTAAPVSCAPTTPPSPNDCSGSQPKPPSNCWTNQCGCGCLTSQCACDVMSDCRTTEMKEEGCCPINPLTGLPL